MSIFDLFRPANINEGVEEYKNTKGAKLLDVRTADEYRGGHISGSINIPVDRIQRIEKTVKNKTTPLFVHCYSGSRSRQAFSHLKRMGYTSVKNIGGISRFRGRLVR